MLDKIAATFGAVIHTLTQGNIEMSENRSTTDLKETGERLLTEQYSDTTLEHLHRYALAVHLSEDKDVLDIASGEGYGSNLLASTAKSVLGVDIAEDAVLHAQQKYQKPNLAYRQGPADNIPVDSGAVDVVVSFETIEHHDRHDEMLSEIKRVLRDDGLLIMSTPDKRYYTDLPQSKNPFHVKELYLEEFRSLIKSHFANVNLLLQKISYGSLVIPESKSQGFVMYSGDHCNIHSCASLPQAVYAICVASNGRLPITYPSFWDGLQLLRSGIVSQLNSKQNQIIGIEHELKALRNSWSFRIGRALTWAGRSVLHRD